MAGRRIIYLASLLGCLVFYYFYREWLSWLFLMTVGALPWFSLLVSLPAIFTARGRLDLPGDLQIGEDCQVTAQLTASFPIPPFYSKLRATHAITGATVNLKSGKSLPTAVCGRLRVRERRLYVCDYLGLFRFPVRRKGLADTYVRPVPVPLAAIPDFAVKPPQRWKPKPGGGFAENHELRLYRPGDNLQQIHWKLSAKTGKLILREAMEPIHRPILLTLDLCGSGEELNRKLGRLLWLSELLCEKERIFDISALTGQGVLTWRVAGKEELKKAFTELLSAPAAESGTIKDISAPAGQLFHIGGEQDEE